MNLTLDHMSIAIPCPACRKEFDETIGRLKNDRVITCNLCGTTIETDMDKIREGIQSIEKALNTVAKTLGKISQL